MTNGELGEIPGWYDLITRFRSAAQYLGCDFFELLARAERGEWHWLTWAELSLSAERSAYGAAWPPQSVVYTVPWRPSEG